MNKDTSTWETSTVYGQEVWAWGNDQVEIHMTVRGGHLFPITFDCNSSKPINPYYLSPWWNQTLAPGDGDNDVAVLAILRGDFFCMPFGGNNAYQAELHPPHGEVSFAPWKWVQAETQQNDTLRKTSVTFEIPTQERKGHLKKVIHLIDGSNAIYQEHVFSGLKGPMCYGHHPMLPGDGGPFALHHSPVMFMETMDIDGATTEKHSLLAGSRFTSLSCVPGRDGTDLDLRYFPGHEHGVDIVAMVQQPSLLGDCFKPSWTVLHQEQQHYLWYSLKNTHDFPVTLLWMEHRGRAQSPWNGTNSCIGVEDICGYFAHGLKDSAASNPWSEAGIKTHVDIDGHNELTVKHIQGVLRLPDHFTTFDHFEFEAHELIAVDVVGTRVRGKVNWEVLGTENPIPSEPHQKIQ